MSRVRNVDTDQKRVLDESLVDRLAARDLTSRISKAEPHSFDDGSGGANRLERSMQVP